jgi:hypothetical protein
VCGLVCRQQQCFEASRWSAGESDCLVVACIIACMIMYSFIGFIKLLIFPTFSSFLIFVLTLVFLVGSWFVLRVVEEAT